MPNAHVVRRATDAGPGVSRLLSRRLLRRRRGPVLGLSGARAFGAARADAHTAGQRGIALIAALVLLIISTVIALGAMRGSIVQERMTFNHDARTEAYMAAEGGAAAFKAALDAFLADKGRWPDSDADRAEVLSAVSTPRTPFSAVRSSEGATPHAFYTISQVTWSESSSEPFVTFRSTGERFLGGNERAEAEILVRLVGPSTATRPGLDGILACQNINIGVANEAPRVASFDPKTYNPLSGQNPTGTRTVLESTAADGLFGYVRLAGNAHVTATAISNAGMRTEAGSRLTGSVVTAGSVVVRNSSQVDGTVRAGSNVEVGDGGLGARITGDVLANGDLRLNAANNRVVGNATLGGVKTGLGSVDGVLTENAGVPAEIPLPRATGCDPLGIDAIAQQARPPSLRSLGLIRSGSGTNTIGLNGFNGSNTGVQTINFMGREVTAVRFDSLQLGAGDRLRIVDGDVLIVVDGNFQVAGSALGVEIAEGANVTFVVSGTTSMGSEGIHTSPLDVKGDGFFVSRGGRDVPRFGLFSTHEGAPANNKDEPWRPGGTYGVQINAGSEANALNQAGLIYAPKTNVRVLGAGGWFGALAAQNVNISGRGFFYNEGFSGDGTMIAASRIEMWREAVGLVN